MKTALLTHISVFFCRVFFLKKQTRFFSQPFPSSKLRTPGWCERFTQVAMLLLALLLSAFTLMRQLYRNFRNRSRRGDPFLMTDLMPVQRDNRWQKRFIADGFFSGELGGFPWVQQNHEISVKFHQDLRRKMRSFPSKSINPKSIQFGSAKVPRQMRCGSIFFLVWKKDPHSMGWEYPKVNQNEVFIIIMIMITIMIIIICI